MAVHGIYQLLASTRCEQRCDFVEGNRSSGLVSMKIREKAGQRMFRTSSTVSTNSPWEGLISKPCPAHRTSPRLRSSVELHLRIFLRKKAPDLAPLAGLGGDLVLRVLQHVDRDHKEVSEKSSVLDFHGPAKPSTKARSPTAKVTSKLAPANSRAGNSQLGLGLLSISVAADGPPPGCVRRVTSGLLLGFRVLVPFPTIEHTTARLRLNAAPLLEKRTSPPRLHWSRTSNAHSSTIGLACGPLFAGMPGQI